MRVLSLVLLAAASCPSAQAPILGVWHLDETTGFAAQDAGPFANHGTLFAFTNNPAQWVAGVRGNALAFDGIDDYVELPVGRGLPFYDGRGAAFSVSMWVNGAPTDDDRVLCLGSSASDIPLFSLGTGSTTLGNAGKLRVYARNDGGTSSARYSSITVFDNTWHHVVYTEVSGQATLWVDGVRDPASFDDRFGARGTRSPNHGTYTLDKCALGSVLRPSPCCYYQGALDEVVIHGYPLSAADVQAVFGGGVPATPRAGIGEYGVGCGAGPLDLYTSGSAVIGGPGMVFSLRGGRASASVLLLFGLGAAAPQDLTGLGFPYCTLYSPRLDFAPLGALSAEGTLTGAPFPIPNFAGLACFRVVFQAVAVQGRQADFSNAIVAILGS